MVERIRTLLARFPENEEAVRRLVARDVSFDALCNEYGKVIKLLDAFEAQARTKFQFGYLKLLDIAVLRGKENPEVPRRGFGKIEDLG